MSKSYEEEPEKQYFYVKNDSQLFRNSCNELFFESHKEKSGKCAK